MEGGDTWKEGGDTWKEMTRGVRRLQRDRMAEVADLEDAIARDEHVVGLEVAVQHLRVMIQV